MSRISVPEVSQLAHIYDMIVMITFYMILASEFILRFLNNRPIRTGTGKGFDGTHYFDTRTKLLLGGLALSSIAIYIR